MIIFIGILWYGLHSSVAILQVLDSCEGHCTLSFPLSDLPPPLAVCSTARRLSGCCDNPTHDNLLLILCC